MISTPVASSYNPARGSEPDSPVLPSSSSSSSSSCPSSSATSSSGISKQQTTSQPMVKKEGQGLPPLETASSKLMAEKDTSGLSPLKTAQSGVEAKSPIKFQLSPKSGSNSPSEPVAIHHSPRIRVRSLRTKYQIDLSNSSAPGAETYTTLKHRGPDVPGLLAALSACLALNKINVVYLDARTGDGLAENNFRINREGNKRLQASEFPELLDELYNASNYPLKPQRKRRDKSRPSSLEQKQEEEDQDTLDCHALFDKSLLKELRYLDKALRAFKETDFSNIHEAPLVLEWLGDLQDTAKGKRISNSRYESTRKDMKREMREIRMASGFDCWVELDNYLTNLVHRSSQEIMKGLYIGGEWTSMDLEVLKKMNITHIVTCNKERPRFPDEFLYMVIGVDDSPRSDLLSVFDKTHDFIQEGIENGGCVLVHCEQGVSRSAAVSIAFCMRRWRLNTHDAEVLVRRARPIICPNYGFVQQLYQYNDQIRQKNLTVGQEQRRMLRPLQPRYKRQYLSEDGSRRSSRNNSQSRNRRNSDVAGRRGVSRTFSEPQAHGSHARRGHMIPETHLEMPDRDELPPEPVMGDNVDILSGRGPAELADDEVPAIPPTPPTQSVISLKTPEAPSRFLAGLVPARYRQSTGEKDKPDVMRDSAATSSSDLDQDKPCHVM